MFSLLELEPRKNRMKTIFFNCSSLKFCLEFLVNDTLVEFIFAVASLFFFAADLGPYDTFCLNTTRKSRLSSRLRGWCQIHVFQKDLFFP